MRRYELSFLRFLVTRPRRGFGTSLRLPRAGNLSPRLAAIHLPQHGVRQQTDMAKENRCTPHQNTNIISKRPNPRNEKLLHNRPKMAAYAHIKIR